MPDKVNTVQYGLSNAYYAVETETDTYGTPVAFPGAVSITLTPKGDSSDFYADNMIWYHSENNQGYDISIEMAIVDDDFRVNVLGYTKDETTKALVETRDAKTKRIAFGYQIEGDKFNRRAWLYGCSVSRAEDSNSTKNESVEPQTQTFTLTAAGLKTGEVRFVTASDTPEETYNSWFEKVVIPGSEAV